MTGPRNRRAVLRTGALAVAGLAGCVGGDDADDGNPSSTADETKATTETTAETTATTETVDETTNTTTEAPSEVEFTTLSVQSSFFYLTTPDSLDVAAVGGEQFAFVRVSPVAGAPPAVSDLALVADGRRYSATTTPGPIDRPYSLYDQKHVYAPDDRRAGWVAFEVPDPLDAEEVALARGDRERSVGEEFRAALRGPPAEFRLVSLDVPKQVASGESFDVTCTVENVGDGDGVFRACLNQSGPMYGPHATELSVPAGERRERVWTFGPYEGDETERVDFRFRSPVADREATVGVVS